jgi:hypothetical protein
MKLMKPAAVTAALFLACGGSARADTVVITTVTTETPQHVENANMIEMSAFDRNGDGILSMKEVGDKLFDVFDRDGNRVIDNVEFRKNSLLTIAPMEKETVTYVDYDAAKCLADKITYTREEFMKLSQLVRFAGDMDGLSPEEFMDKSFLALDDNDDKVIDREEWQEAYADLVRLPHEEEERYNS